MRLLKSVLPLGGALLAFAAPSASAGTARVMIDVPQPPHGNGIDSYSDAWYEAAPGEVNDVTVSYAPNGEIVIQDTGAPVTAGDGCRSEAPDRVVCEPLVERPATILVNVRAGDGDDRVTFATSTAPPALARTRGRLLFANGGDGNDVLTAEGTRGDTVTLDGEGGADRVTGGLGDDTLYGGSGADALNGGEGDDNLDGEGPSGQFSGDAGPRGDDALDGGPGADTVSYDYNTAGVTVDLKTGVGGEPGEADRYTSIEGAIGTREADVLLGTDGPDALSSLGGKDRIDGRGGDDVLQTGGHGDRVICGDGSRDLLAPSGGTYQSSSRRRRPSTVPSDCERVEFGQYVLTLPIRVSGGVARLKLRLTAASDDVLERGRMSLTSAGRVIGTKRLRRSRAATRTLKIRLTPAGRRALAGDGTLTTGLQFSNRSGVQRLSVTLRR